MGSRVQIARRLGFTNIHLESDALNLLKTVEGGGMGLTSTHVFYEDVCNLSPFFSSFSVSHMEGHV